MPDSRLATARRQYYGNNATPTGAGGQFYDAYGRKTGARIDGRVKRKTMMGGASQGPISSRPNRSEAMEMEAAEAMERGRQKGIERAKQTSVPVSAPVRDTAKPSGKLIPGHSPGSSIWVKNDDPRLAKPMNKSAVPSRTATPNVKPATGQDGVKRVDDMIRKALPPSMQSKRKSSGTINGRPASMVLAEARRRRLLA